MLKILCPAKLSSRKRLFWANKNNTFRKKGKDGRKKLSLVNNGQNQQTKQRTNNLANM